MEKVFEIYIKTTPERLWEAITDTEMRSRYTFGVGRRLRLDAGFDLRGGSPRRGDHDQRGREPRGRSAAPARAELQRVVERGREARRHLARDLGDRAGRRLLPAHGHPRRRLREGANDEIYGGWPMILSGLKTLLETGREAHDARLADVREGRRLELKRMPRLAPLLFARRASCVAQNRFGATMQRPVDEVSDFGYKGSGSW